jgi:hypothetical protein
MRGLQLPRYMTTKRVWKLPDTLKRRSAELATSLWGIITQRVAIITKAASIRGEPIGELALESLVMPRVKSGKKRCRTRHKRGLTICAVIDT